MSVANFIAIVLIVVTAVTIVDGMRAREQATRLARRYCREAGLQFLDGTVALRKWAPRLVGGITFMRRFEFHYARQDHQRHIGVIVLLGHTMTEFVLLGETKAPTLGEPKNYLH